MRLAILIGTFVVLALLSGCEGRAPLSPAQVSGMADNYQRRENLAWGSSIEVLPPAEVDAHGHRWWQVRYAADPKDGGARVVVVDDESGWARQPPPGYIVRVAAVGKPGAAYPVVVAEGNFVLALTAQEELDEQRRGALEREVVRLNTLAGDAGLVPLFSLRRSGGRDGLVYGWQKDRGIARDERVVDWLKARTPYHDCAWVDLTQP